MGDIGDISNLKVQLKYIREMNSKIQKKNVCIHYTTLQSNLI